MCILLSLELGKFSYSCKMQDQLRPAVAMWTPMLSSTNEKKNHPQRYRISEARGAFRRIRSTPFLCILHRVRDLAILVALFRSL